MLRTVWLWTFPILALLTSYQLLASKIVNNEAELAYHNGDIVHAQRLFSDRVNRNSQDIIAHQYLAKIERLKANLDRAQMFIDSAIALAPNKANLYYDAARINASQVISASIFSISGFAEKTLFYYKKAVQLNPDNIQYRRALMNFYLRAPAIFGGDTKLALEEANAIARLDDIQGVLAMADYYQLTEDEGGLLAIYDGVLETEPNNIKMLLHRGNFHTDQSLNTLAQQDFLKVIDLTKDQPTSFDRMEALFRLGVSIEEISEDRQFKLGVAALREYIQMAPFNELLPDKSWAKYHLAELYLKKGHFRLAGELMKDSLQSTYDIKLKKKLKYSMRKLNKSN